MPLPASFRATNPATAAVLPGLDVALVPVALEDLDVEKSGAGKQEYKALRGRGVPIIPGGDQRMDGYEPSVLDRMLRAAGY
jgi:hypothetical protein